MGSPAGAVKTAARRIGADPDEYAARVASGEKWCGGCRTWHLREAFGADPGRSDGLMPRCRAARSRRRAETFVPVPAEQRKQGRPPLAAPRDGDVRQARRRVNYLVEKGELPHPNTLPCIDCGHRWSEGSCRHEYDHHLGYAAEHHEHVEPVCSACHHMRHP